MKTTAILSAMVLGFTGSGLPADDVQDLFKEAWKKYQEQHYGEVTGKLRELIKRLEDMTAQRVEAALPEQVADWSGGALRRESLDVLGGGVSLERAYRRGAKEIRVKVVKDSPAVDKMIELLGNDDLLAVSGKRVHTVFGEKAIVESERKLLMVIEDEMLVELVGDNDTRSSDLVGFARKLDVRLLKEMR